MLDSVVLSNTVLFALDTYFLRHAYKRLLDMTYTEFAFHGRIPCRTVPTVANCPILTGDQRDIESVRIRVVPDAMINTDLSGGSFGSLHYIPVHDIERRRRM